MRLRLWFGVGVAMATAAMAASAFGSGGEAGVGEASLAPASSAVSGVCSRATALAVMFRYRFVIKDPSMSTPIRQVLCGAFTGQGSRAMAVSIASASCRPVAGWEAFRYVSGAWRRVPGGDHRGIILDKIAKSGNQIVESEPLPDPGQTPCGASNERARAFHWNGSRLVAGPWTTVLAKTVHLDDFLSPDRKIWCRIVKDKVENDAWCGMQTPERLATVKANGRVTICNGIASGDCLQNWDDSAPFLRVGQTSELDGFRCTSATNGITCTVIAGSGAGKGFQINTAGVVTTVGP